MAKRYHRVMRCIAVLALFAAVACGASAAEVKTAQTATYNAQAADLYQIALEVASVDYKIADAQPPVGFATMPQWYTHEGGRQSAGAGDMVQIEGGSVRLSIVIEVVEILEGPVNETRYAVKVTPKTFEHLSGSPQPRELAPDDPNIPGWIPGRVESLQVAIYKRAQQFAAK
jgi:hypothetical protein